MNNMLRALTALAFGSASAVLPVSHLLAQPAPAPRAVITAQNAPEAAKNLFENTFSTDTFRIIIPGAAWLQLQFSHARLQGEERLSVIGTDGQIQNFSAEQLVNWDNQTAIFNGGRLDVRIEGTRQSISGIRLSAIVIGLPAQERAAATSIPSSLRNFLGPDGARFILQSDRNVPGGFQPETICGSNDDRVPSRNVRVGRIMPVGCTGWLISRDRVLTAGHCIGSMTTLQFNVPNSGPDGTVVAPPIKDQYPIRTSTLVFQNTGIGDDWAVFSTGKNTETGMTPSQAQGGFFQVSRTDRPTTVSVTGFGVDNGPMNQTQQTAAGPNKDPMTDSEKRVRLRYVVDTQGGNSGSPVISAADPNLSIGIHTNGGCTPTGGENAGTGFGNEKLWDTINK